MFLEVAFGVVTPLFLYVIATYLDHLFKCRFYPPGPFPLPIIGNLHLIGKKPHEKFVEYSKKYGEVFSLSFGMHRVVIVSGKDSIREVLVQKSNIFAGRPKNYIANIVSRGYKNIGYGDIGPKWKILRKIAHSSLKNYGESTAHLETLVVRESEELHKNLYKKSNRSTKLEHKFGVAVLNVICSIVFGKRYEYENCEFKEILTYMNYVFTGVAGTNAISFIPWLRFLPLDGLRKLKKGLSIRDPVLRKQLLYHRETYNESNLRDYTDYVIQFSRDEAILKKFGEQLTDDYLELLLNDIFIAGTETALTTLLWSIIYLIHWPKFQDKIYNEIVSAIGKNRYPSMKDRNMLPLVNAALSETLRLSSVTPLGVPHKAMEDTTLLNDLKIPKGTTILTNLWQLHHNKNCWENPHEFNPYRWFTNDQTLDSIKSMNFLPFSAGTRVCLGKGIAEVELFLFYSRLVRDFKFEVKPGDSLPSLYGNCGITLTPQTFKTFVVARNDSLIASHENVSRSTEQFVNCFT
ncbi:steroid 17-alpha-hydroxylase/17,20 lyase isoform X2 [Hydra vulgaris]|nr:steroid 17-alpha-hydroxylase/17,20 lyase isoform X2 [Hydra vulgaris]XP_047127907.1 steroid 17-alpha-hydroxylase/17,20 lyase isoform X2 [Hydra vulgaris]XP_047127911.1 steroid 17-alpha-hydroxylase/17,20 lyase isoform X2 [Hydra vulgaris]